MIGVSVQTDGHPSLRPQVSACADETKRSKRKFNLKPNYYEKVNLLGSLCIAISVWNMFYIRVRIEW